MALAYVESIVFAERQACSMNGASQREASTVVTHRSSLRTRRSLLRGAGATALAAPFVGRIDRALAAWPGDRPVRIIVPNSPGGPSDLMARFMAPVLQEALGATFIVENKAGGGSNIGMTSALRAEPDGYTLLLATSSFVVNAGLFNPPPYDAINDVVPVVELTSTPTVIVVRPELGVSTLQDMVALARRDPDKFNIATPPLGSTQHLGAVLLKQREGLDKVAIVLHTGGGQAIQALLSSSVQACSSTLAPAHPLIQAGSLKGLAILGEQRWPDLPDIPTAAEAGYADFNFETFTALLAPARTPPEIVRTVEQAAIAALARPELRGRLLNSGFVVLARGGDALGRRIAREVGMFKDIIVKAGIKI